MSSDHMSLEALCVRTKARKLRYVELVTLPCPPVAPQEPEDSAGAHQGGESSASQGQQVFFCIGEHALFLVRRSMGGLYPSDAGGEIFLANILSIVEDVNNSTDLLIVLNDNRPSDWTSEKLYINCEHRERLADFLQVAWQTDVAWRLDAVQSLPRTKGVLRASTPANELRVRPFRFYQEVRHEGYSFFIKGHRDPRSGQWRGFEDLSASMHSGCVPTYHDKLRNVELSFQIFEEKSLVDAERRGLDHIRWVAMDQKASIVTAENVLIVRNCGYVKKMNLANDLAQWTGWELHLRSQTHVVITIFLRRQYFPPAMDAVQDLSITIRCPLRELKRPRNPVSEDELLLEARLAADSAAPVVENCTQIQTVYRDLVQAKLDTLYFNEDAVSWLQRQLHLSPRHELEASQFVKAILRILQEENALSSPDLLNAIGDDVKSFRDPIDVPHELVKLYFGAAEVHKEEEEEEEHHHHGGGGGGPEPKAALTNGGSPKAALAGSAPGLNREEKPEELVASALGHERPLPVGYNIRWNPTSRQNPDKRMGCWQASFTPENGGHPEMIRDSQRGVPREIPEPELREASMECVHEVYDCVMKDSRRRGALNSFLMRVARYFAYCIDGALLGTKFTIQDITSPFIVTQRSQDKLNEIILFLLHMRPRDMNQPFKITSLRHLLHSPTTFRDYMFNDRVMQALVELKWIDKQLRHPNERDDGSDSLSLDYVKFLARVLVSPGSSTNLKAAVCRQIMGANQKELHHGVLLPPLMELIEQSSTFIKTYATVTLVNMSSNQEKVKHAIMGEKIARLCCENLRSQDDDLVRYTLLLLTQLTKNPHHRSTMAARDESFGSQKLDLDKTLLDMLLHTPCMPSKYEIISELASVIGQLCNDHEMYLLMCKPEHRLLEHIQNLFELAPRQSRVRSKLMYALKQFCAIPYQALEAGAMEQDPKEVVGKAAIPHVVEEVRDFIRAATGANNAPGSEMARRRDGDRRDQDMATMQECATNAILLLVTLSTSFRNIERLKKRNISEVMQDLNDTKLAVNDTLAPRLEQLRSRIDAGGKETDKDHALAPTSP